MIIVHHLNNSRSQRILWLLEELELPYEIKKYERDPVTMLAPAELRKVHPLGKSPVLTDGENTLAESGAIIEYLVNTYGKGKFRPASGTKEFIKYNYWLHYAEGSAMSPMLLGLIFSKIPKQPAPFFIKPILKAICGKILAAFVNPQIKLHSEYMDSELAKSSWFAGNEFSAADIQMSFPVEAALARGGKNYANLKSFTDRIYSRPAYKRALEKGGPYELLR